jgi:hypothetical protein
MQKNSAFNTMPRLQRLGVLGQIGKGKTAASFPNWSANTTHDTCLNAAWVRTM